MGNIVTITDLLKAHGADKNLLAIGERVKQSNQVLQDIHWEPANDRTSHLFAFRTYVPLGEWRLLNQGTGSDAPKTQQGRAYIGMHENRVEVDKKLVQLASNPDKFFSDQIKGASEGSAQTMAATIFYGNHETNPAQFSGLAPQLDKIGMQGVYDALGTAANALTSIFGIQWGPGMVYMVHPENLPGPITLGTKREETLTDTNGKKYRGLVQEIEFNAGLVIEDPKAVFRIPNLDITKGYGEAGGFDEDIVIKAINKMRNAGMGAKMYCNADVQTMVDIRAKDKGNVSYTSKEVFGNDITHFKGRPFRLCEGILNTEERVTA